MALFDQRGQHVNYQYNAAGNINFGAVQNSYDLAAELEKLEAELTQARDQQAVDRLTAAKAATPLLEAAEEAKKPEPDKRSLLSYLDTAKDCLKGVAAVGGIVEAVTKACEWVEKML
jgi:hypothetical protein